ncbi:IS481 family transposase [Microvirga thermotolerans]|uniref:IS481 family transposase n=1 Tax=Microvirga thermotolerans TaxID=2651334 RepID=A0A5P9K0N7_9HYPH|nr:IS481 family transposase [Microvirga thermotolerans]QFU15784.1 IS481 family transposase [Microvirga thermotolerans]
MNAHKNARMTPFGRALLVQRVRQERWRVAEAAKAAGISERTASKWLARFRDGGEAALHNKSSAPRRPAHRLAPERIAHIAALRQERLSGPAIARTVALPRSTVGAVLRRLGLNRLRRLEPRLPAVRYERERPGELIHIDTKKLGRIAGIGHRITGDRTGQSAKRGTGWEALHVAIDDASRLAYTEILPNEKKDSALAFLNRALAFFARHGVGVERVMTDNGAAYKSHVFQAALAERGIRHKRTKPYRPQTNGKAERFIQTSLREWIYGAAYASSAERSAAMKPWLTHYNTQRPHSALKHQPPWQRLNNLLGNDI